MNSGNNQIKKLGKTKWIGNETTQAQQILLMEEADGKHVDEHLVKYPQLEKYICAAYYNKDVIPPPVKKSSS